MEQGNDEDIKRLTRIRYAELEMNRWRAISNEGETAERGTLDDSFDESEVYTADLEEIFEIRSTG